MRWKTTGNAVGFGDGPRTLVALRLSCRLMAAVAGMAGILVLDKPVFEFGSYHLLAE